MRPGLSWREASPSPPAPALTAPVLTAASAHGASDWTGGRSSLYSASMALTPSRP